MVDPCALAGDCGFSQWMPAAQEAERDGEERRRGSGTEGDHGYAPRQSPRSRRRRDQISLPPPLLPRRRYGFGLLGSSPFQPPPGDASRRRDRRWAGGAQEGSEVGSARARWDRGCGRRPAVQGREDQEGGAAA
ncbi:unnamed protein product [Urochloa humidicola]